MAIPGPEGIIHASYKPSDGKPILLDHDAPTPNGHQRLTWNQEGPEGPPGEQGEPGPAGPSGLAGYELVNANFHNIATLDERQVFRVEAPQGKVAISGGYGYASSTAEPPAWHPKITGSYTTEDYHEVQIWTGDKPSNDGFYLSLFAVCVNAS